MNIVIRIEIRIFIGYDGLQNYIIKISGKNFFGD